MNSANAVRRRNSVLSRSIASVACLSLLACWANRTQAEFIYQFTKVVDAQIVSGGTLGSYPGLNNNNQVSYVVRTSSISGSINRWDFDTQQSTQLSVGSFISSVPINDSGAIGYDIGSKGFVADDNGFVELFSNSLGVDVFGMNASGDVVAALDKRTTGTFPTDYHEIRVRRDGGSSRLVFSDRPFQGEYRTYGSGGPPTPDINDSGDVVARGTLRSTSLDGIHIHTASGGIITVDDTSGPLRRFGNIVDINNSGDVAYYGTPDTSISSSERNLYLYESGVGSSLIADHADFDSISEAGMLVNNNRDVIFNATAGGVEGLFTGGDPVLDRILSVGEELDGGVAVSFLIRKGMFNDSGNFVFTARLDDDMDGNADRHAVFFANATAAVPEPSSLILATMVVPLVLGRKRRNRI